MLAITHNHNTNSIMDPNTAKPSSSQLHTIAFTNTATRRSRGDPHRGNRGMQRDTSKQNHYSLVHVIKRTSRIHFASIRRVLVLMLVHTGAVLINISN